MQMSTAFRNDNSYFKLLIFVLWTLKSYEIYKKCWESVFNMSYKLIGQFISTYNKWENIQYDFNANNSSNNCSLNANVGNAVKENNHIINYFIIIILV